VTPRARAVALAFTVACLLLIARQVRRRQMRATYLVIWTSLCLVAIPFIAIPGAIEQVSSWLGIYYPPATVFLLAIVVLFLISVHFSRQVTRLEERTRILAEELAMIRLEPTAADPQLVAASPPDRAAEPAQPR
jgi:hypothetical protein